MPDDSRFDQSAVAAARRVVPRPPVPPAGHPLSPRETARAARAMRCLAEPDLTDAEALPQAERLAEVYRRLDSDGRADYLAVMTNVFGAPAGGGAGLGSPRTLLLRRFNLLPDGLRFLVDLRADCLDALKARPELAALDADLEVLLSAWFDVGLLEMRQLTWHSPASLLEKLVHYEAVHAIASWSDLKNRLDSDRRCYAFFHPRLPDEPLIFVEVAFTRALADNVQVLLDESAPVEDSRHARTAIFYSISNTQRGLRGLSFGNFLLKRVIEQIRQDSPRVRTYATLSPMPGLRRWAERQSSERLAQWAGASWAELQQAGGLAACAPEQIWTGHVRGAQQALLGIASRYLLELDGQRRPVDPVARFHLNNGARIERLNWCGDTTDKGWQQSYGLMVNYLYDPTRLNRHRVELSRGRPATGPAFQRLLGAASAAADSLSTQ